MRKARDGLKVEYTRVNLKHLQTQPPGKVITGVSPPVRISHASVQRNLLMPSNQKSTSVVDCITMPCLIQNVSSKRMEGSFFFFLFFFKVTKFGRDWAPCCLRENKDLHDCVFVSNASSDCTEYNLYHCGFPRSPPGVLDPSNPHQL